MVSAAPPTEYIEGINWNLSFYTTGDSSVSLNYVNSSFLRCTGYAYSRALATTFNNIVYFNGSFQTTDITVSGTITPNLFKGSGAELTNLNATNISDGTLTVNRGGTVVSTLVLGHLLIGNGADPVTQSSNLVWDTQNNNLGIRGNPASKLDVNGTVSANLFSGSDASLTGLTEVQIPDLNIDKIIGLPGILTTISFGSGVSNLDTTKLTGTIDNARISSTDAKIPDLDAGKITSGTINNDRITLTVAKMQDFDANKITAGTINNDRIVLPAVKIPSLDADKITGTLNNDRLTLTVPKLLEASETSTFIVNPSNKFDIPPVYSFNITAYDKLFGTSLTYLEASKFTCSYEDRNGTCKLIPQVTPVSNKLILNYRVGDKIVFKNTADPSQDYENMPGERWGILSLFKMPQNITWNSQGQEIAWHICCL